MLRVGVIGCGYWGPNLVRNFAHCDGVEVLSVCDTDQSRLSFISKQYPSVKLTTDARSVFQDPAVDAVAVATPISTHYPLAKEALEAGKHTLVEKPLTARADEADELIGLAEARGLTLMVDHTFLFTGAVIKMKEIIEAGEIGRIYYYDSVRVNLGLFQDDVSVLWDLAPHDVSIMQYLLNERPVSVTAVGMSHFQEEIENIAYITVHLENDLIAHFHVNWLAPVKIRKVLIGGSERMIVYDDLKADEKVCIFDRGINLEPGHSKDRYQAQVEYRLGDMLAPKLDRTEPLRSMCQHFVDCIQNNVRPISDGPFGLGVVRVLEAAEQSIRKNGEQVFL